MEFFEEEPINFRAVTVRDIRLNSQSSGVLLGVPRPLGNHGNGSRG